MLVPVAVAAGVLAGAAAYMIWEFSKEIYIWEKDVISLEMEEKELILKRSRLENDKEILLSNVNGLSELLGTLILSL